MSAALEYAFATAEEFGGRDRYVAWCAVAGLQPVDGGYGVLMMQDAFGRRVTKLTENVEYLRLLVAASKAEGGLAGLEVPPGVFSLEREGWPDEWGGGGRPAA